MNLKEILGHKQVEIKDPITIDYGDLWDIVEQNKRYREVLVQALNYIRFSINEPDKRLILEENIVKALEGEE